MSGILESMYVALPQGEAGDIVRGTIVAPLGTISLSSDEGYFDHFGGVPMSVKKTQGRLGDGNTSVPYVQWKYAGRLRKSTEEPGVTVVPVHATTDREGFPLKAYQKEFLSMGFASDIAIAVTDMKGVTKTYPLAQSVLPDGQSSIRISDGIVEAKMVLNTDHFQMIFHWTLFGGAKRFALGILLHTGDTDAEGNPRAHTEVESICLVDSSSRGINWFGEINADTSIISSEPGMTPRILVLAGLEQAGAVPLPQRWSRQIRICGELDSASTSQSILAATPIDSWREHGYLPAGFKVSSDQPGSLGWAQRNFANLQTNLATLSNDDPNGVHPDFKFWPVTASEYGGVSGGNGIDPLPNFDLLSVAHQEPHMVVQSLMISSLRVRSRHSGIMTNQFGHALLPATDGGQDDWEIFNRQFTDDKNVGYTDPIGYTDAAHPDLGISWVPSVKKVSGKDYAGGDFVGWSNVDDQHLIRAYQYDMALAELIGDEMALTLLRSDAALAVLGNWHLPGKRSSRMLKGKEGEGSGVLGRGEAWCALVISYAAASTQGPDASVYRDWLRSFCEVAENALTPNSMLGVKTSGKVVTDPPMNSNYHANRLEEEIFLCASLLSASAVVGMESMARAVVASVVDAIIGIGWKPGEGACVEKFPVRTASGGAYIFSMPEECWEQAKYGMQLGILPSLQHMAIGGVTDLMRARLIDWVASKVPGVTTIDEAHTAIEAMGRFGGPGGANPASYASTLQLFRTGMIKVSPVEM